MGALVAYRGCPRCSISHCRHAPARAKPAKTRQNTINLAMGILAAFVLFGGGAAVKEAGAPPQPAPTVAWTDVARRDIPGPIQVLYAKAAGTCPALSPFLLAGIGRVESNHGKSNAPGVHEGVNFAGCCRGPMQFNTENGSPSTWDAFAGDYDHDGQASPYDPGDAIPAAARKLCANGLEPSDGNRLYKLPSGKRVEDPCPDVRGTPASHRALMRYNAACWYVQEVIHHAISYAVDGQGVT